MAKGKKSFVNGILIQNDDKLNKKELELQPGGSNDTKTTVQGNQSVDRTVTLPDADDTLVGRDTTDTLTNKTIDGDDNTVQDLALSSLKTDLPNADKFIERDASGDVVAGKAVPAGDVVGTTDTQILSNKTLDGNSNTISNLEHGAEVDNPSSGVHGVVGNVVGTSDAQILENKTIDGDLNTISNLEHGNEVDNPSSGVHGVSGDVVGSSDAQALTNKTIDGVFNTLSNLEHGSEVDNPTSGVHGVVGNVVGTTDSQSLENKTIDADNNTISNLVHGAEVDNPSSGVHGVTGSVVGTSDTQTLSGKSFSDAVTVAEIATPSTPASGFGSIYPKSDGKWYRLNDGGVEEPLEGGSGSGIGGINYITNFDAEDNNTSGWATYDDGAVDTPVDGTGGSPAIVWETTTATILRGDYSFRLNKTAGDKQGQGVSYDFTIDEQDKNSTLYISFDCEPFGAAFVADTVKVFVYDKDNAQLITPRGSITSKRGTFSFPTTDADDYRLILHNTSTATGAWFFYVDTVIVGPDKLIDSPIVTDWADFTPSFQNDTGLSFSTTEAKYRRVGDTMELKLYGQFTGTGTSGSDLLLEIPDGADILHENTGTPIGVGFLDPTTGSNVIATLVRRSTGAIGFRVDDFGATQSTSLNGNNFGNTGSLYQFIGIDCSFGITDWQNQSAVLSTTEMMNETDSAQFTLSSTQSGIDTNASYVKIALDTLVNGDNFTLDAGNNRLIAKKKMKVVALGSINFGDTNTLNSRYLAVVRKNGTDSIVGSASVPNAGEFGGSSYNGLVYLEKDDYLELFIYGQGNNSASTYSILAGVSTFLHIIEQPDYSVYSTYGEYEVISATSSAFSLSTAGYVTGEWMQMVGNSVTLSAGTWELAGASFYDDNGAVVTALSYRWSTVNGDNTTSVPTAISADTPNISTRYANSSDFGSDCVLPISQSIVTLTEETTIYLTTQAIFSSAASADVINYITAKRLR